jgi:hypothetical protein
MKLKITTQQKEYIYNNYLAYTDQVMAEHLGVSKNTVINARKAVGLQIPKEVTTARRVAGLTGRTTATTQEDAYIKKHYLTMPVKVIAAHLGRGFTFVSTRLRQLGLEIPAELRAARKASTQLKKGDVPPNKGRKQKEYMSQEAIERTAATRFKPGQKIYNEKYDGAIRERKDSSGCTYRHIRIARAKWVLYHRYLWQQQYGEIPKGMVVVFKDGNSANCVLENLELITRTENMLRNSKHHYPKEIIPTLTLINQLKNKINEKQTNRPKQPPIYSARASR